MQLSETVTDNVYFVFVLNCRYQNESAALSHWLQTALDRLEFWTTQSVTVPQELETVRDHLYAFLVSLAIMSAVKTHHRLNNNIQLRLLSLPSLCLTGILQRGGC